MVRTKVLLIHSDLDLLSKIYLTLLHRNFKAEACNNADEYAERVKRLKPSVVVLDLASYQANKKKIKVPAVIVIHPSEKDLVAADAETRVVTIPVQMEAMVNVIQELVI